MVAGICGVLLFAINAIFCLVLLIMVLVSSVIAIVSRDPEVRYQTMRDNRSSFIKSGSNLRVDELDALGATARGSGKLGDDDSIYSPPMTPRIINHSSQPSTSSTNFSRNVGNNGNIPTPPRSPIGMATPFPPDTGSSNHLVPNHGFGRAGSPALGYSSSAGPDMHEVHYPRTGSSLSQATNRSQLQYRNGAGNGGGNMWQRGAGYEH